MNFDDVTGLLKDNKRWEWFCNDWKRDWDTIWNAGSGGGTDWST